MCSLRGLLAAFLCILISFPTAIGTPTPEPVLGVLTRASDVHLNALPAFVGQSVFEGESISTEVQGKLGVPIGSAVLALSGNSSATLHRIRAELTWIWSRGGCISRRRQIPALPCSPLTRCCARRRINQPRRACGAIRNRCCSFLPSVVIWCLGIETSLELSRKTKLIRSAWTRKVKHRSRRERRGQIHRLGHEVRS
jgi:hypothetical protein